MRLYYALLVFPLIMLTWKYYYNYQSLIQCGVGQQQASTAFVHFSASNHSSHCVGDEAAQCVPPIYPFVQRYKVSPKYKLAACVIEKNFSTMLTAVMCYLFNEDNFVQQGRNISTEVYQNRFCANVNEYESLQTLNASVKRKILNKIAIVRDPLNRFVSGFVNKCLREQVWKKFPERCNGCNTNMTCFAEKLYSRMMQWSIGAYSKPSFDDNHFFPQNWRCEFNAHLHEYRILKFDTFDPSRFINELLQNLEHNGVPAKALSHIKTALSSSRTGHSTIGSQEQYETRKIIFSNKYLIDLLIKMYYYDFVLFGFPIPELVISL